MKITLLKKKIKEGKSSRLIAKECECSLSTIRHWLRKYKLSTNYSTPSTEYKCKCGETNPKKFYGKKRRVCAKCHSEYATIRNRKKKAELVKYKGGKCIRCGYNKYQCSLDFHHLNPKKKDINFIKLKTWNLEKAKKELDKCILLCKNCHSAFHAGYIKL